MPYNHENEQATAMHHMDGSHKYNTEQKTQRQKFKTDKNSKTGKMNICFWTLLVIFGEE